LIQPIQFREVVLNLQDTTGEIEMLAQKAL